MKSKGRAIKKFLLPQKSPTRNSKRNFFGKRTVVPLVVAAFAMLMGACAPKAQVVKGTTPAPKKMPESFGAAFDYGEKKVEWPEVVKTTNGPYTVVASITGMNIQEDGEIVGRLLIREGVFHAGEQAIDVFYGEGSVFLITNQGVYKFAVPPKGEDAWDAEPTDLVPYVVAIGEGISVVLEDGVLVITGSDGKGWVGEDEGGMWMNYE